MCLDSFGCVWIDFGGFGCVGCVDILFSNLSPSGDSEFLHEDKLFGNLVGYNVSFLWRPYLKLRMNTGTDHCMTYARPTCVSKYYLKGLTTYYYLCTFS